ncbi:TM2 domain-containing protein [Brachyspira hyodysenteriae]|uniref:TM2 domain-containing protein n=1 Tax=Brachyspira hyodysenteriae TaxID=159 RepID=UPI0022CDAD14|nr:TM2 domain-containing protein [Brachyspira hyodysenteriae]MCZ9839356.1 TM2 domain-containing protein [Brachyspira hyodysenteriae]MCZ9847005.1 TM2 domain-containing protein [Brachyspira hyodysenteriae]MCZ9850821.1 TM2 domain-containing protein [Brachyspira hyodysenteriae]MCZ9860426.1 TM2 domain-containing protein [Brachyspira hyodysenteriae]MCZ9869292.1 TM2 domain-containing protein [Brachyspira hyodysenteriae]
MLSNELEEQNIKETREKDERYCSFCGKIITKHDEICEYCGARQMMYPAKKWSTCLLLFIFLWEVGAHRFYAGKPITAVLFILTIGGAGIWWIIDLIMILTKNFTDYQGRKIKS